MFLLSPSEYLLLLQISDQRSHFWLIVHNLPAPLSPTFTGNTIFLGNLTTTIGKELCI